MTTFIPCKSGSQAHFSRTYPVDHEEGRGSCLAISFPGGKKHKKEEQERALLRDSDASSLRAWTTSATVNTEEDDFSGMFPDDPFKQSVKQEAAPPISKSVTPDSLLKMPTSTGPRRRKSPVYEGEREPVGVRGQEATVPVSGQSQAVTPNTPSMRSFSSRDTPKNRDSIQLFSPQETAPPRRDNPRERAKNSVRGSFLELMPVAETSIPEGVEEESTDDGNETSEVVQPASVTPRDFRGSASMARALYKARSPERPEDSKRIQQDSVKVRDFSASGPQKPRSGQPKNRKSVSMERAIERGRSRSTDSSNDQDLQEMMPDLIPTPTSSDSRRSRPTSSDSHRSRSTSRGSRAESSAWSPMDGSTSPSRGTDSSVLSPFASSVVSSGTPSGSSGRKSVQVDRQTLERIEKKNAAAVEYVEHGEYDMALMAFEQVLAAYRELYGDAHPLVASTYHNLGMVHSKRAALLLDGTFHQNHCRQQSLECFQAAARTGRDSLGPNHPNVAVSLVRVGFLLLQARQYQNAFVTFKEALRIRLEHYGREPPHSLVANLYNNLGVCKMHLGQYQDGSSLLKTALDIQRKVLRRRRQEEEVSRRELRNCLLEVADTLCNLGGLFLEWIRQQGPDPRHSSEAERAFAEALEIRTTVLGPTHALVHQVRTLHEMARSTPLPTTAPDVENSNAKASQASRPPRDKPSRDSTPRQQKDRTLGTSFDSTDLNQGFMEESPMTSESSRKVAAVTPSRSQGSSAGAGRRQSESSTMARRQSESSSMAGKRQSVSSPPLVEIRVGPDDAPPRRESLAVSTADASRDTSELNLSHTRIRVASHCIPRTAPLEKSRDSIHPSDESGFPPSMVSSSSESSTNSPIALLQGLRDLSLESTGKLHYGYDAEESCMIGEIGGDTDRATSLLVSMLEGEDSFDVENSRTLSAHEIVVVRPFEGGFESPASKTKKTASWNRAMANGRHSGRGNGDVNRKAKKYYDSPTVKLTDESGMYGVSPERMSDAGASIDSALHDDENGLAPLSDGWVLHSNGRKTGTALTKEILDNPENHLDTIYEAAGRYLKRDQYREALHLFQTILDSQRRMHGELHPDVGSAWHNVGITFLRAEKHEKALRAFEKAVRVRKGSLGKDHPDVAVSLVKVGITQLMLHDFETALLTFRDALAVRRHSLGALHPSTARVYNNIGCVHMEFHELPDARRAFEAALDIQRNALCNEPTSGPLIFGTATTLCNLGYFYRFREMPERAVLVLKEALGLQEHILGPNHQTVLSTMDSLADASAKSGEGTTALQLYGEILDRYQETLSSEEASIKRTGTEATLLFKMSRVHRIQNDHEAELSKLQMALQAIRSIDDSQMNDEERAEIDRLSVLISGDIQKVSGDLDKDNYDWL